MTPDMDAARAELSRVFQFADFLPHQETIIRAALAGEDLLAVLPTGGGKSLCYQLPALLRPGLTVVVSPLIALMRDQVMRLRAAGIAAGALNSANEGGESLAVERAIEERRLKLVYVAPERFALPGLIDLFKRGGVHCLAIDEAHCISQWGHDFRPEYLALGGVAGELGVSQTIAFTATADAATRAEIIERLFPRAPRVLVSSFDRPNLRLAMTRKLDGFRQIAAWIEERRGQSGIVYCATRERTERFASALSARGHRAVAYHAGLDPETRAAHQDEFLQARGVVMCATIAFGMGVDKPDVRFVCHADTPGSIEAYYQEIGRAGRDGLPAETLTLWSEEDFALRRRRALESGAKRARKSVELSRLDALWRLCDSAACRRQTLLAAFGEASPPCGNCDNCDGGLAMFGARHSTSARLGGAARLIARGFGKALAGEATQALRRRAFEWPAEWLATRAAGASAAVPPSSEPQAPEIESAGVDAALWAPPPQEAAMTTSDRRLLTALKSRRLSLARDARRPAHAILADHVLANMVARRPRDMRAMAGVEGLAAGDLSRYGAVFLDIILAHEAGAP